MNESAINISNFEITVQKKKKQPVIIPKPKEETNCMSDNFGGPNVVVCNPPLNWGEGWYCQKFNHNMNTAEILLYTNKNKETN